MSTYRAVVLVEGVNIASRLHNEAVDHRSQFASTLSWLGTYDRIRCFNGVNRTTGQSSFRLMLSANLFGRAPVVNMTEAVYVGSYPNRRKDAIPGFAAFEYDQLPAAACEGIVALSMFIAKVFEPVSRGWGQIP